MGNLIHSDDTFCWWNVNSEHLDQFYMPLFNHKKINDLAAEWKIAMNSIFFEGEGVQTPSLSLVLV